MQETASIDTPPHLTTKDAKTLARLKINLGLAKSLGYTNLNIQFGTIFGTPPEKAIKVAIRPLTDEDVKRHSDIIIKDTIPLPNWADDPKALLELMYYLQVGISTDQRSVDLVLRSEVATDKQCLHLANYLLNN